APSEWVGEVGTRLVLSSGRMQWDECSIGVCWPLGGAGQPDVIFSRLTEDKLNGYGTEGFARFDHRSRVFVKGNFGLGSIRSGNFYDEDFVPALGNSTPYSNTLSDVKQSAARNAAADVGYSLLRWDDGKIGAYAGYRYLYERVNGFGCQQLATTGTICN